MAHPSSFNETSPGCDFLNRPLRSLVLPERLNSLIFVLTEQVLNYRSLL